MNPIKKTVQKQAIFLETRYENLLYIAIPIILKRPRGFSFLSDETIQFLFYMMIINAMIRSRDEDMKREGGEDIIKEAFL